MAAHPILSRPDVVAAIEVLKTSECITEMQRTFVAMEQVAKIQSMTGGGSLSLMDEVARIYGERIPELVAARDARCPYSKANFYRSPKEGAPMNKAQAQSAALQAQHLLEDLHKASALLGLEGKPDDIGNSYAVSASRKFERMADILGFKIEPKASDRVAA